jgi:hypothetical protein
MIFSKDEPESLEKIIPPLHGSVQGFEISQNSHHAVSQVYDFERYTVIYSFYRKEMKISDFICSPLGWNESSPFYLRDNFLLSQNINS